ncbi:virion core protein, T7 gp14 family [Methylobacterium ajmalii]|jgi:excinuclease UvrABC nuclease subunit|uniref:virion core protein, T7 gp14 family n=1 Tax=Methylobacterium ajmalii TaxID=2738439 RepID=UPI00190D5BA7|nr:hypothetical protein [Methylobacterium ajmalii]MBK3400421.1 hypothetical protein [Methylobacterium ajmalii]MBK3407537.1 hypothetical protein [Methylobacterium ajmalii]MBK3422115.1 hypothetical protein [Methylobacterium ajmalii]MBZ6416910.1 hypothetical protein [Methylobacterium sp.]
MCVAALPILGLAMSAASAVVGFAAKQQQYEKDVKQYNQNYQNALAANRDDQRQIAVRQMQEEQAFRQKDHVAAIEQAQKESQVSVAAASAGVGGLSVGNLIADIHRNTAQNRSVMETNWMNTAAQLQTQNDAATNRAQSRIQSMPVPTAPSPLSMFVDIGGSAVKAFSGSGSGGAGGGVQFAT